MLRIAESLIEAGIDTSIKDIVNNTALSYCQRIKNVPLYEYLQWYESKKTSNKERQDYGVIHRPKFMFAWEKQQKDSFNKKKTIGKLSANLARVVCSYI